jgi:hypothetical protein
MAFGALLTIAGILFIATRRTYATRPPRNRRRFSERFLLAEAALSGVLLLIAGFALFLNGIRTVS